MALTAEEARVLGSLIEKEATVPDSYPLSLNTLRLACNQTTNRHPVLAYDDRTVENALLSLKSMGLVRFVHPSHGGRTTRYRHSADERWRLSPQELAVLSVLIVRGPQTVGEVRSRAERHHPFADGNEVEEILDTLAGRSPEPFAIRLERRAGEREARWAHLLSGEPDLSAEPPPPAEGEERRVPRGGRIDAVEAELAELRRRLDRLERLLDRTADS
ncbi:MAG: YceH family protein [Acidimicrobiales bacterium]